MNELDAVGWAIRLAKRIESMHALGVTHGSISPECLLLEGGDRAARAQLVDLRKSSPSLACQSPERVKSGILSQADDTWALACTLYAALTGSAAFQAASDAELPQKILTSSPAPLAVFDVGDDDLQRILEEAFARDVEQRTSSVAALRAALEEWHPDPNVGALPAIEEEDTDIGGFVEDDDERTIMRAPSEGTPARLAAVAFGSPFGAPAPRASSPGGGQGVSPRIAARPADGFPPPGALPPGQRTAPSRDDDEDDDDVRTVMRTAPEHFASSLSGGATRSGAFAAVAPGKSGAFPAPGPSLEGPHGMLDDDEATRMLPAPALLGGGEDDDDEQKTLMRSSLPPDEVGVRAPEAAPRPLPAAGALARPEAPANVVPFPGEPAAPWGAPAGAPSPAGASFPVAEPAHLHPGASPPGAPLATPAVAGAAPVALASATAPLPVAPPRRLAVWLTLLVLLVAAVATYLVLRMR